MTAANIVSWVAGCGILALVAAAVWIYMIRKYGPGGRGDQT